MFVCFRACKNQRGQRHRGEVERGGKATEECDQHAMQGRSFSCYPANFVISQFFIS